MSRRGSDRRLARGNEMRAAYLVPNKVNIVPPPSVPPERRTGRGWEFDGSVRQVSPFSQLFLLAALPRRAVRGAFRIDEIFWLCGSCTRDWQLEGRGYSACLHGSLDFFPPPLSSWSEESFGPQRATQNVSTCLTYPTPAPGYEMLGPCLRETFSADLSQVRIAGMKLLGFFSVTVSAGWVSHDPVTSWRGNIN